MQVEQYGSYDPSDSRPENHLPVVIQRDVHEGRNTRVHIVKIEKVRHDGIPTVESDGQHEKYENVGDQDEGLPNLIIASL